jgi:chromosome segregation ATPase
MSVWFADGTNFISTQTNSDRSVAVQNYLHNFGVQEYKDVVKYQLEQEQKKQKDMEKVYDGYVKDQKRAENNIKDHNKEIEKLQNKIVEEQQNIQKAQTNQATSRADADRQKVKVQEVSDMLNNIK